MGKLQSIKNRIQNAPVIIHPLFIIFGCYCYLCGNLSVFVCYTLSAVIHEFGHFIVAKRLGYKLLQIRLMPYGADLCGNVDEFLYKDEIKIALAGPITSVILSGFLVMIWWIFPSLYNFTIEMCVASIVCGVFNILPIYPLDGGRVLVAVLNAKMPREKALSYAKISTRIFATVLFFMFIMSFWYGFNPSFAFVSIMLLEASFSKSDRSCYFLVANLKSKLLNKNKIIEVLEVLVNSNALIYSIVRKLSTQKYYKFLVVDENMRVIFSFGEDRLAALEIDEYKSSVYEMKGKLKGQN